MWRFLCGAFETWQPPLGQRFDLVFAATAWHWIDPAVRYQRAFDFLRPGGHLAFWSAAHVLPEGGDPSATSTGRSATAPSSTSVCSTRSPGTSPCRPGSGTASTARSGAASRSDPTTWCAVIGVRSSTSAIGGTGR